MSNIPFRRTVVGVVMLAALALPGVAWPSGGPAYQAGATASPPTIDGTITPAEWAGATAYSLTFGSIPATVRFERTATDLYIGVVVTDLSPGTSPGLSAFFDNDHDGLRELGDDAWLSFIGLAQDFFYSPTGFAPGGAGYYNDSVGGGPSDTVASATSGSGGVTFEIQHPLCSGDSAHDICATVGQTLGVDFQYQPTVGFFDAPGTNPADPSAGWGDLLLASGGPDTVPPTVHVTLPVAGSVLSGTSVAVAADATDNVGVTSVHFQYYDPPRYYDLGTDNDAPYTATFNSTTVPNTVPLGATMYATATDAAGNHTTVGNGVGVNNPTAVLSGSVVAGPDPMGAATSVDLTAAGNIDWAVWGSANTSLGPDVRKSGGSAISDLTNIDPGPSAPLRALGPLPPPAAVPFLFNWFDGGSQPEGVAVKAGLQHNGGPPTNVSTLGKGFSFDVPAGTAARTLTVYVATNRASGQLTASLSDSSAPSYVDTLPFASETRTGIYTIHYAAASRGQTLHVQWVETLDNCADFRCDNAAVYAVALSSDATDATLSTEASVAMSGSNDRLADLPLRAFEPAPAGVTPAPINGLPINGLPINGLPINGLPINGLPINGLPINGLPINGLPINGLPINGLPINGLPINGLPINGLPLTTPGGWAAALAGTSLDGLPLQTITLQQVLALPLPQPAAIAHLTLGQLDLSNSALGRMTIGALALGSTPINGLGLPADALASLQAWCLSVVTTDAATKCAPAAIGNQSLFALALAGAPINGLPINGLPINGLPISGLPINGLPINGLDLSASPINGLPINGLTLAGTPINGLSLTSILAAHASDGSPSPFRGIKIADLASIAHVITDCTVVNCVTGTLGDAAAASAIKSTALLADIGAAALGSLTLGDLHFYGTLTIGDLEQSLVGTNATLGDLIGLLVKRADVPWETLTPRLLSVFDPSRPRLHLTTSFNAGGTGVGTVSVQVHLPPGFDVVPGTATFQAPASDSVTLGDPTVDGDLATWSVPSVALGASYTFHVSAFSGTDVGPAQASVTVSAGGTTSTSSGSFDVLDSFASGDGVPVITPDVGVQQSAIARRGAVDYYKVALPPAGTRLLVHLTNLRADYDLALFASQTTSVRTGATAGAPLQDGTVADQSINTQGGLNAQLTPTALQDVPNPGIPAVQVSANRGADDEDVGMVSPGGTGYALIAVYGYNGAESSKPYSLRVTTQAPLTLTCNARSFTYGVGTAGALPTVASMPNDLNTLILVNAKRIGDTYGGSSEPDVVSALSHLAGDRSLGVSGAVIPVESLAQSQYNAWDQNPCDVRAANAIANAIANKIAEVKAARPGLKYIVFAGGDDQIPFFRIPDLSRIANESGFASSFDRNEYYGALATGNLLTDDPYLDTRPIPASGRQLFVPDLIGGRLVEKPTQIISAVSRFETSSGTLARSTAFVSGYDFVTDGSTLVQSRLNTFLGTSPTRTLINDTWSKSQLLAAAFPTGGSAAINDWNGHYDNHQALAADGNQSNLIATTDLTGPYALSGGIFFTMGCHAGFQTTDAIVGSASPDKLDWSEYFAGSGTSFVGNTGFGLGNTDSVAFSEELMAAFAGNLGGSLSIGAALANAKQSYYLGRTAFSSYDEKTLSEAELYGLPMYGVGVAPAALGAPLAPVPVAPTPSPDPVRGASSSTSPNQGTLTALPSTSINVASFDVVPSFTARSGSHGDYLTSAGQVQAPNYRPLQPFVTLPASRTGVVAHGVLVDGLSSSDLTPFNPDNVRPTLDLSAKEPEPQFADEAWPTKVPTLVSLDDTNGLRQSLNLTTGQFFTDGDTHAGVERKWTHIAGRVTYSSSTDFVPPSVDSIDAFLSGGAVTFSGRFSDLTETGAPGSVALAQVVYDVDNTGTWLALPLQFDATSGAWSGGAAFSGAAVQYFVEACDGAGNCGYSSNKGRYFDAQPLPAPSGPITLTPSRPPDKDSWYTGPLDVTPATTGGGSVSVSIDGGALAPATGAINLRGDGSHIVDARGSDGSEATGVFFIDTSPPTVTVTCPTAPVALNANATAAWTATDNVSGILGAASGTTPLDTSTLGTHTATITAADNTGHPGTGSCSYTVNFAFTGFFSPVDNRPTLNVIKPGQAVPVKFGLGGNRGLAIFATGYPAMETITCASGVPTDLVEQTVTAGSSSLQYDSASQQYSYVWKTPSSGWPSGACRQLILKFVDGTSHIANFKAK
ncbi:MAG: large repetitive protein [Gaiellaceae bacterium]|nr:large repetitive protein [Gaiellaceae bacterium]